MSPEHPRRFSRWTYIMAGLLVVIAGMALLTPRNFLWLFAIERVTLAAEGGRE